jgi:hypothetical protein
LPILGHRIADCQHRGRIAGAARHDRLERLKLAGRRALEALKKLGETSPGDNIAKLIMWRSGNHMHIHPS